eukprot:6203130-Pleurochrysis_carterae.AAC.1
MHEAFCANSAELFDLFTATCWSRRRSNRRTRRALTARHNDYWVLTHLLSGRERCGDIPVRGLAHLDQLATRKFKH